MKIFDQVLLFVFILGILVQAQDYKYEIIRRTKDRFKLPSFLCTSSWRDKCKAMGGTNTNKNCTCKCTNGTNNVFGYFDKSWNCTSNHEVRRDYSDCNKVELFEGELSSSTLRVVLKPGGNTRVIGTFQRYCEELKSNSKISYLNCNGEWKKLNQSSDVGFSLKYNDAEDQLFQRERSSFNNYNPSIYGHVVKLHINCYTGNFQHEHVCVLVKVQGNQNCPVALPTTSSPAPPPTTSTTTTQSIQSTASFLTRSSTSSKSYSTTQPNEKTTATTTATEIFATTNTIHPMTDISSEIQPVETTNEKPTASDDITNSPQKESANTDGSSGGAIGGAVGGIAAVIIIVVILIIILKGRRKRCAKEKRESVAPIADNLSYHNAVPANGQLEFPDDDEYSYAYTNNHPIVIKDQNGKAVTGSNVANGHNRNIKGVSGSLPNQQAPVYSTLQDPNYAKLQTSVNTSNGPSYNVLARPENQWMTRQGPVYDVLEDSNSTLNTSPNKDGPIYNTLEDPNGNEPTYNTLERPENQWVTKQGPVYDVLDDPNSTGAPVYSVLEGPNSNDQQVYDALEDQDPNVYGSLDSPDPHVYGALYSPTSKSAPAYDNDIYDCAGGTIIDEDTYQELNETDQRSSDIYQPVRPPRNAMAMKNMSGITQSQA